MTEIHEGTALPQVDGGLEAEFVTAGAVISGRLFVEAPFRLYASCDAPLEGRVDVRFDRGRRAFRFTSVGTPDGDRVSLTWPDHVEQRDRRRFERIVDPDATHSLRLEGGDAEVLLRDISVNGAAFVTRNGGLSQGDRVPATLTFPDNQPTDVVAEVLHAEDVAEGQLVRVHFLAAAPTDSVLIEDLSELSRLLGGL